ncbi:hypothetical protein AB0873_27920 [Micromonospora sp. NPDC047707]|uniref:hypothetical protein n=1 Tax=Micromonospora sp. NPDC047707 TaxID=3154498 RepID=UPI003452E439
MDRDEVLGRILGLQDGLITRAQALRIGFSRNEIDWLAGAGRWRPVARAVYLVGRDPQVEVSRRCEIRAALLSLGPHAHAVLGTAAELHGIAGLPQSSEIHVADDDLLAIPRLIRGRRGAVAARSYLAEADGRAQSPLETRARLRCVDGRVPPDVLQLEVRDGDGYLLGVGDLGWRASRVIAEADGRGPHGTPDAIFADRRRQNRLVNAGWTILRFTWQDTLDPAYIPWTVRNAITTARARRS